MQRDILLAPVAQLKLQWNPLLSVGILCSFIPLFPSGSETDMFYNIIKVCPHKMYVQLDESTDVDDLSSH